MPSEDKKTRRQDVSDATVSATTEHHAKELTVQPCA